MEKNSVTLAGYLEAKPNFVAFGDRQVATAHLRMTNPHYKNADGPARFVLFPLTFRGEKTLPVATQYEAGDNIEVEGQLIRRENRNGSGIFEVVVWNTHRIAPLRGAAPTTPTPAEPRMVKQTTQTIDVPEREDRAWHW